jgi:hypothetical protein
MGTPVQDTDLIFFGKATNIDQKWKGTVFQVTADEFYKAVSPIALNANEAHRVLVNFLGPIAFAIGTGTQNVVFDMLFA